MTEHMDPAGASSRMPCWDFKKCGRQPGGSRVQELGVCPAAGDTSRDGINGGQNGGRMCWVTAGTFCGGTVQGSFAQKVLSCLDCEFFSRVRAEEDGHFKFLVPGREYEEVAGLVDAMRELMQRQEMTIRELSTPVLEVWDHIIVLPIIGVVDTRRSLDIMERLLGAVVELKARYVIVDITGVDVVDTKTADHFIKVVRAGQLLGAQCMLTGMQPAVAQTLVEIGVDLESVTTLRNLQSGLSQCLRDMQEAV